MKNPLESYATLGELTIALMSLRTVMETVTLPDEARKTVYGHINTLKDHYQTRQIDAVAGIVDDIIAILDSATIPTVNLFSLANTLATLKRWSKPIDTL
ncbi:MAG: hypothetical protein SH821_14855 [Phototrophicales bacterium]|nr:hypothetical protein [Phototrophicales bacterium]